MGLIAKFYRDDAGASSVEYALLMAFIAVAVFASLQALGTSVGGVFQTVVAKWPTSGG